MRTRISTPASRCISRRLSPLGNWIYFVSQHQRHSCRPLFNLSCFLLAASRFETWAQLPIAKCWVSRFKLILMSFLNRAANRTFRSSPLLAWRKAASSHPHRPISSRNQRPALASCSSRPPALPPPPAVPAEIPHCPSTNPAPPAWPLYLAFTGAETCWMTYMMSWLPGATTPL